MQSRITIFQMNLPAYGTIVVIGIVLVTLIGIIACLRRKLSLESFLILEASGGAAALVGAKLWYMAENLIGSGGSGLTLKMFLDSGYSFYGGLALGLACVFLAALIIPADFKSYAENLIFLVPLMHGIWKIACFMGGCCYGIKYSGPGAVVFPEGVGAPAGIPLFPVQLLEAFVLFVLTFAFWFRGLKGKLKHPIAEYTGFYAASRFFIEFLRYHESPVFPSTAQVVSLILTAIVLLYIAFRKKIFVHIFAKLSPAVLCQVKKNKNPFILGCISRKQKTTT